MSDASTAVPVSVRDLAALLDRAAVGLEKVSIGRLQYARLLPEGLDNPADDLLIDGQESIRQVVTGLLKVGAPPPSRTAQDSDVFSLVALHREEDQAVQSARQALAAALVAAIAAADELDRLEGNWWDGDVSESEPRGTNYADTLHQIRCRLLRQMETPKGRGE